MQYHCIGGEIVETDQSIGEKKDYRLVFYNVCDGHVSWEPSRDYSVGLPIDSETGEELEYMGDGYVINPKQG